MTQDTVDRGRRTRDFKEIDGAETSLRQKSPTTADYREKFRGAKFLIVFIVERYRSLDRRLSIIVFVIAARRFSRRFRSVFA